MSYLQEILTSDGRTSRWEPPQIRFIHEIRCNDRQEANALFNSIEPIYKTVWEDGTWDGRKYKEREPKHDETSSHSYMWVDEHKMGFSVCISFTNQIQRNEMKRKLNMHQFNSLKQNHHFVKINESERIRLDLLETATHSVELDISNSVFTPQIMTDFMNVALTLPDKRRALYADLIPKDGKNRLKGYFPTQSAADNFRDVCDLKIRTPLINLIAKPDQEALASVATPVIRKFITPKMTIQA